MIGDKSISLSTGILGSLTHSQMPNYFRGFAVKPLAYRIAGQGILDAAKIGNVANSAQLESESWEGWGSYDDTLTLFRGLWCTRTVRDAQLGGREDA